MDSGEIEKQVGRDAVTRADRRGIKTDKLVSRQTDRQVGKYYDRQTNM
jgi:hypothetical protein